MDIVFLSKEQVERIHAETLPQSGNANDGLLEGALNRVRTLHYYEGVDDIHALAAMYLIGIAKAHAFHDGINAQLFRLHQYF